MLDPAIGALLAGLFALLFATAALQKLRARLPEKSPLTGVQLGAEGSSIVVQEGNTRWQAESGQVLLSFDQPADGENEVPLAPLTLLRARAWRART